jgi:hypothetical protein
VTPYLSECISVRRRGSKVYTWCLALLYFAIMGYKLFASMMLLTNSDTPLSKTVFRDPKAEGLSCKNTSERPPMKLEKIFKMWPYDTHLFVDFFCVQ